MSGGHGNKKRDISPIKLDFEDEDEQGDSQGKPTFSDVETDQENSDWDSDDEDYKESRGSPTQSLSVFDKLGKKLNNKDLRHRLMESRDKADWKAYTEKSLPKDSMEQRKSKGDSRTPSQPKKSRSTRLPTINEGEKSASSRPHSPPGSNGG